LFGLSYTPRLPNLESTVFLPKEKEKEKEKSDALWCFRVCEVKRFFTFITNANASASVAKSARNKCY